MPILLSVFQWCFSNKKAAGFFACGFAFLLTVMGISRPQAHLGYKNNRNKTGCLRKSLSLSSASFCLLYVS
jgi:hypothetical protein